MAAPVHNGSAPMIFEPDTAMVKLSLRDLIGPVSSREPTVEEAAKVASKVTSMGGAECMEVLARLLFKKPLCAARVVLALKRRRQLLANKERNKMRWAQQKARMAFQRELVEWQQEAEACCTAHWDPYCTGEAQPVKEVDNGGSDDDSGTAVPVCTRTDREELDME